MNDRLSDFATRLRNAYLVGKTEVGMPHTKLLEDVAKVLTEAKYLAGFEVRDGHPSKELVLQLSYHMRRPALKKINRISKPGVRIYQKSHDLYPILNGLGIAVLSTSHGVMSNIQAKKAKLGGEVLLELW